MKLKAAILLPVMFLAACGKGPVKTEVFADEMQYPAPGRPADTLTVQISVEYPAASEPVATAMTEAILNLVFDGETAEDVATMAERYEANLIDEFGDAGSGSWEERLSGFFSEPYKDYVNYYFEYYGFHGGAHGISSLTPIVFRRSTGEVLNELDILSVESLEVLPDLIQSRLLAALDGNREDYDSVIQAAVTPNGCFEVGPEGITWYYQPGDIGPYSLGVVPVTVDWAALKPYLR